MKKILAGAAAVTLLVSGPAMAQLDRHQNPSLNSYVGHATVSQYEQPTAFNTGSDTILNVGPVGSGNPSLESFNPNSVQDQPTRFETAPNVVENPNFDWIDQYDIGA